MEQESAMGARFRSWWQKRRKLLLVTGILALLVAVGVLIWASYANKWGGAGFANKTVWDWLQLLIVPLVLALIALVFQRANSRTERQIAKDRYEQDQQIAKQRYEQDQQIALDKQREDLLQAYLDRMSELLLKEKLRSSAVDAEVRNVARVRTITILTQLDARRIGYVFAFLREARLMSTTSNNDVVILSGANFRSVNWSQADLSKANLSYAYLGEAKLRLANLNEANLGGVTLLAANLSYATLGYTDLSHAYLGYANLSSATLNNANLNDANLSSATLSHAILFNADLSGADLSEADLSGAYLVGAVVTEEQLKKARSLEGATMPDGSVHP